MDLGLEGALGSSPDGVRDDDDTINISDVIEVIQTTDPDFKQSGMFSGGGEISTVPGQTNTAGQRVSSGGATRRQAYVKILEQPASKALRFRYECEGRSAGSIPGASSTPENKTFPAIQVIGYQGRAVVVVSCVTKDPPYRPHPHNLVGREGCRRGVCTLEVSPETMAVTFSNLGIQCVKKKDIEDALKVREEIRVDPFRTGFAHRNQPTSIDLNAVRLCFQVFLEGDNRGKFTVPLSPVVSDPIYDKKAMSDLVICKLSDCTCTVAGGKEIILLCEKVAKEDIQVRFYEESNGAVMWEALGDFQPTHVHKQVAISFRTPRYRTLEVSDPVKVFIQLRRPSDGATSESLPFELLPLDSGRPAFWSLRRALHKKGDYNTFNSILAADRLQINKHAPTIRQKPLKSQNGTAPLLFQSKNKIDEVEIIEPPAKSKPVLETNLDEVEITVVDEWQQNDLSKVTNKPKDWCDYSEVEKISVNPKDIQNMQNIQNNNNNNVEEKSLNDLLNQVAELDEIYSDTQARLLTINDQINDAIESEPLQIQPMEVEAFDDSNTYSSLQLAFKNPIEIELPNKYDDVITVHGPVIEIAPLKRESDPEKLPPLPPKRIKKSIETPILDRAVSQNLGSNHSIQLTGSQADNLFHTSSPNLVATPVSRANSFNNITRPKSQELLAPSKKLPPTPCSTLPNPKKQSFLSKLFSKKPKKDKTSPNKANSTTNLNSRQTSLKTGSASLGGGSLCNISNSNNDGSIIHISLHPTPTGSLNDVNKLPNNQQNLANNKLNGNMKDDDVINLDLTEAEHYALYTAMAPHATQSEFDEMSCYYAPVEGGKVLNNQPDMAARLHSNT